MYLVQGYALLDLALLASDLMGLVCLASESRRRSQLKSNRQVMVSSPCEEYPPNVRSR